MISGASMAASISSPFDHPRSRRRPLRQACSGTDWRRGTLIGDANPQLRCRIQQRAARPQLFKLRNLSTQTESDAEVLPFGALNG